MNATSVTQVLFFRAQIHNDEIESRLIRKHQPKLQNFESDAKKEYIEEYFKRGLATNEMLDLLAVSHGVLLSKRTINHTLMTTPTMLILLQ